MHNSVYDSNENSTKKKRTKCGHLKVILKMLRSKYSHEMKHCFKIFTVFKQLYSDVTFPLVLRINNLFLSQRAFIDIWDAESLEST